MADPTSEPTVVEAIDVLRGDGYTTDLRVTADGRIACGACGTNHEPADATVERVMRFEGVSDPDDEAVVFGLRCRHCGATGVLVAAYGPSASAEEAAVVASLT